MVNKFGHLILNNILIPEIINKTNIVSFVKSLGKNENLYQLINQYNLYGYSLSKYEMNCAYNEYELIYNDHSTFLFDEIDSS